MEKVTVFSRKKILNTNLKTMTKNKYVQPASHRSIRRPSKLYGKMYIVKRLFMHFNFCYKTLLPMNFLYALFGSAAIF